MKTKRKSVLLLVLSATVILSMLASPLYAAAQTPPSSGTTGGSTGSNGNTTDSTSLSQTLGFNATPGDQNTPNPFGTPDKTLLDHMSIAGAGLQSGEPVYFDIWDAKDPNFPDYDPFAADEHGLPGSAEISTYDWRTLPKVMTAADINGTSGYQQVLTAFLAPDGISYDLYLSIEDYNTGTEVGTHVQPKSYIIPLVKGVTITGLTVNLPHGTECLQNYKSHFQIVATEGRVAILVNNTLYDYKLSYTAANGYTATLARQMTFNKGDGQLPMIDLTAGDVTNDGLQDLVVVDSPENDHQTGLYPYLAIYKWEQDNESSFNPLYTLPLFLKSQNTALWGSAVAVGNVTGNGTAVLVSGYTAPFPGCSIAKNTLAFLYVTYDAGKGQFNPSGLIEEQSYPSSMDQANAQDLGPYGFGVVPDLAMVSFGTPNPGEPQYVFYDGWVFQYDTSAPVSAERFTPIYSPPTGVYDFYFDTAIGNLVNPNPDQPPAEQLAVLAEDSLKNGDSVFWYSVDNNGQMSVTQGSYSAGAEYPALSGAVVKGTVLSLNYVGYAFAMTDPKVVAVLGASPYYQELLGTTGNGNGNEETTFGTSQTVEHETSNSLNVSAGVFAGLDVEVEGGLVIETKLSEIEATVDITGEFTKEWASSTSVTTSEGFSAVGDDMVVVTSTPYDLFTYRVSDPGNPQEAGQLYTIGVPRQPQIETMNLSDYNAAVPAASQIPPGVLDHTVGNPRSYVSVSDTDDNTVISTLCGHITGIEGDTIALPGSFVGAGLGDGLASQSISSEATKSASFGAGVAVTLNFKAVVGFFEVGGHTSVGYSNDTTDSIGQGTEISGSVFNVPASDPQYDFNWELVGYKDMVAGDEFYVVNYVVNWGGRTPPPLPPSNLQLYAVGRDGAKATIGWDSEPNISKYLIYRGTSASVDTTTPYAVINPQAGANNQATSPTYTDNSLSIGQQYYYEVVAESDNHEMSAPTAPLAVPELITGLTVKTQPRLDYTEGDRLDLSALVVTATMKNRPPEDLTLNDLLQRGMEFNISDGTELSSADNGMAISITDPATGIYAVTKQLNVTQAASPSSFAVTISFTVGGVTNATALAAGKTLTADFAVKNNEGSPQSVIAVVALFDLNGSMTNVAYSSQQVAAGGTATLTEGGFTLPWQITGYAARAFILEGTQFSTSALRPLSDIAQISS